MNNFLPWFRANSLALAVLFITAITTWAILSTRVEAIEKFIDENKPLIPRFLVTEEQMKNTVNNINDIKGDISSIEKTNTDILIKLGELKRD